MRTVLLLMICGAIYAQQPPQPVLTMTSVPARPGTVARISVTLSGASGVAAVQWFLPALSGMTVIPGVATTAAGKGIVCQAAAGLYGCIVSGGATALGDGVLALISVTAPSGVTPLALSGMLGANPAGDSPGIVIASGPLFTLTPMSPCDLNGDGAVDALDVRNLIDQIEGVIPAVTDLNGDGKINLVDLQRVVNAAVDGICRVGQ